MLNINKTKESMMDLKGGRHPVYNNGAGVHLNRDSTDGTVLLEETSQFLCQFLLCRGTKEATLQTLEVHDQTQSRTSLYWASLVLVKRVIYTPLGWTRTIIWNI